VPPVGGRLVNGFGVARDEATRSWLFRTTAVFAARPHEPVRAAADGRVVMVAEDVGGGTAVVLEHERGLRTIVSGLGTVTVTEGIVVRRGASLGTAPAQPSPVRIEVWRGRQTVDPSTLLLPASSRPGHTP
jgi:murein DD-endopeptidase MepM/ murein hydrolase activator NlpD